MTGPDRELKRGQLYWVMWEPGRGSEQKGRRPALIVQADPINRSRRYTNTIVVAISTAEHGVPTHIPIEPSETNGLRQRSYAITEQILTISRARLDGYIGEVDAEVMQFIDHALKRVLALS